MKYNHKKTIIQRTYNTITKEGHKVQGTKKSRSDLEIQ